MTREPRWDDVWIVVEMFDDLPAGLWVCRSKESAEKLAAEIAEEAGFTRDEEHGLYRRGDSTLRIVTGDLEPEGSP